MSKLVLNVKYLLLLSNSTAAEFYSLRYIQGKGALIQKRSVIVICPTFGFDFLVG